MDPFSQELLSQPTGSRVAPETLEMLGRKASQMYQQGGTPLNQAIRELVAQHPELGNEHIKRVVEFANNVTFQELFQNGADKNVHFEVADPGIILRDLKDGGSPAFAGQTMNNDYLTAPKQSGMQDAQLDDQLAGMFQIDNSQSVKTASEYPMISYDLREWDGLTNNVRANPLDELNDARTELEGTRSNLVSQYEATDLDLQDAQERLFQAVKQEVVNPDGAGLGGVVGALSKLASDELLEVILPPMASRLVEQGYQPKDLETSLEKRAGAVVNPSHPLVTSFTDVVKLANQLSTLGGAISQVDNELDGVRAAMKKLAGAVTSAVRDAINTPGKLPAGIRQRFPRQ